MGRVVKTDDVYLTVTTSASFSLGDTSTPTSFWFARKRKRLFRCEYCDTLTYEPGNCKNCGAPVVIANNLEEEE